MRNWQRGMQSICTRALVVLLLMLQGAGGSTRGVLAAPTGPEPVEPAWYVVSITDSEAWLQEAFPDEAESFALAITEVGQLKAVTGIAPALRQQVHFLTSRSFTALTGRTPVSQLPTIQPPARLPEGLIRSLSDGDVSICLGLDQGMHGSAEPVVAFLVQLPITQVDRLPQTWLRTAAPPHDSAFWQPLACQTLNAIRGQRNR